jgi:ADP-ribosylglycohydrolase
LDIQQRSTACFKGLSTGDAIGKQSENLSRSDVLNWYPHGISGFHGRPGQVIPRYVGNSKHEWRVGETTDDTEQTIAVSRAILRDSQVTIASAIQDVHDDLSRLKELDVGDLARRCFPDKPETKVPLAINLAVITKSAEATILLAANVGGDADSVASIGGAIAGALDPATINQDWFDVVNSVNDDDLPGVASAVAALRSKA